MMDHPGLSPPSQGRCAGNNQIAESGPRSFRHYGDPGRMHALTNPFPLRLNLVAAPPEGLAMHPHMKTDSGLFGCVPSIPDGRAYPSAPGEARAVPIDPRGAGGPPAYQLIPKGGHR